MRHWDFLRISFTHGGGGYSVEEKKKYIYMYLPKSGRLSMAVHALKQKPTEPSVHSNFYNNYISINLVRII